MQTTALYARAVSWVGSRPVHIHTLNEPYQSSFGSGPRPPLHLGLGAVVWCAPECDCCIHTCPKDPHQEGKRTWVCFNRTKQDKTRCEYTLKVHFVCTDRVFQCSNCKIVALQLYWCMSSYLYVRKSEYVLDIQFFLFCFHHSKIILIVVFLVLK